MKVSATCQVRCLHHVFTAGRGHRGNRKLELNKLCPLPPCGSAVPEPGESGDASGEVGEFIPPHTRGWSGTTCRQWSKVSHQHPIADIGICCEHTGPLALRIALFRHLCIDVVGYCYHYNHHTLGARCRSGASSKLGSSSGLRVAPFQYVVWGDAL